MCREHTGEGFLALMMVPGRAVTTIGNNEP
jgi:hypothetical protein